MFFAVILIAICLPVLNVAPIPAPTPGKALILSTLQESNPMAFADSIAASLTSSGYTVTFIGGTAVTLNLLTTQLNNYDIIVWRTDAYDYQHTTYWYVGDSLNKATLQVYAHDFAAGWINSNNGMLAVSIDFFRNHFKAGSLGNVKLAIIISSLAVFIAQVWVSAGLRAAVDTYGTISGSASSNFYLFDHIMNLIVGSLARGETVKDAVIRTVDIFLNALNSGNVTYMPQVWYLGDGTTRIT
jgi:hypothetical protein